MKRIKAIKNNKEINPYMLNCLRCEKYIFMINIPKEFKYNFCSDKCQKTYLEELI